MSDHGWLRGEYKLPTNQWKQFRDRIISNHNEKRADMYETALIIHKKVLEAKKGKRGVNIRSLVSETTQLYIRRDRDIFWRFKIEDCLCSNNKLVKPKKKDFKPVKNTEVSIVDSDLIIVFDNKSKIVKFISDDSSHSQDNCLDSHLGQVFMRLLNRVQWSTKSGGYLRYFNEHLRDHGESAIPSHPMGKYVTSKKYQREIIG